MEKSPINLGRAGLNEAGAHNVKLPSELSQREEATTLDRRKKKGV
jgi:hypothetical protein